MTRLRQIKSTVRTGAMRMNASRIQAVQRARARRAYGVLAKAGRGLTRQQMSQVRDYAADRLGWTGYADWLGVYTAVSGRFHEGWLPENYYFAEVMPRVNGSYHKIARRRSVNHHLFGDEAFPDLACVVNGLFYDPELRLIPESEVVSHLAARASTVVVKSDDSAYGHGVQMLPVSDLTPELLRRFGNGLVQARIEPHDFFDAFNLRALATLRVLTAINDDGVPQVRGCYLKLGRSAHSHVRADDQIKIAIDHRTGRLSAEGFMSSWKPVSRHPDGGAQFDGLIFPLIEDCLQTALRLHGKFPLPRLVSWDMLPDKENQIRVMEWEGGVVSFPEATQGPCFADLGWDRFHRAATAPRTTAPGAASQIRAAIDAYRMRGGRTS